MTAASGTYESTLSSEMDKSEAPTLFIIGNNASEADQKATLDFMLWCVTDPEGSAMLVDTFGAMPYKQAAASSNKFLNDANTLANAGKKTVTWAFWKSCGFGMTICCPIWFWTARSL